MQKTCQHNLNIISENEIGYVGMCPCCHEVQFSIGTIVSHMPIEAFRRLFHSFQKVQSGLREKLVNMPNGEKIILQTPVDNCFLALTVTEFQNAMVLFGNADLRLRLVACLEKAEMLN